MPNPPNNNDLQREKVRFLNDSLSLQRIIRQGSIANSSRDNVVAPPLTPSITPTISITPSVTTTVSLTPTETPTTTPTTTSTVTPTITPTITTTQTCTVTPTITLTPSVTPTITPTLTITPSVTPTITITPSVTPDYSMYPLIPLTLNQDILVSGFPDWNYQLNGNLINFKYVINGLYNVTALSSSNTQLNSFETTIFKYQNPLIFGSTFITGTSSFDTSLFNYNLLNSSNGLPPSLASTYYNYGNLFQIPASGFNNLNENQQPWAPLSAINRIALYKDLTPFVTTSPSVSTLIIRGLTGTFYTNQNYSANGAVLQYRPDTRDWWYESDYSMPIVRLYYENSFFDPDYPLNAWVLEVSNFYYIDGAIETYNYQLTGGLNNPNDFNIPVWRARSNFYELAPFLSAYAVQPTVQFLNGTGLEGFVPPITPTPTVTVTPSITPTISLTPSITLTPSVTISITPTNTPTLSLTPSVTPTISLTPTITITPTTTRPTPTPTPTVRPDTFPFNTTNITVLGFYGNMEGVEYGISYDFSNTPVILTKLDPPYDWVWTAYYAPYNCNLELIASPVRNVWQLNLSQSGEYGFGEWFVASNNQSYSAIPVKNWTLSPGSSGGVLILNG